MLRARHLIATALLALVAGGCADEARQESGNRENVVGQSSQYLSAVDTATINSAYKQVKLACNSSDGKGGELAPELRAAAGVADRYPNKLFRSGSSDEARPAIQVMANLAQQLRSCGQAKRATALLSRRGRSS